MNTTTCTYCSHDGPPCAASSAKGYLCSREAGHAGRHAACDDEDHPIAAWNRLRLGAYERRNDTPGPLEQAADRLIALVSDGIIPASHDMDGGVTAAQVEKEAERNADGRPYCPADSGEFACSREHGHTGPHVAATCDVQNSICEVWNQDERHEKHNPAHDIDWQEIAEQHEDAIRALIKDRDEALYQRDQWMRANDSTHGILDEAIEERRRIARALDLPENADADEMVKRVAEPRPLTPEDVNIELAVKVARALGDLGHGWVPSHYMLDALTLALSPESRRPDWLNAPAVRAWHKSDGRTEHDGTPGKPRIWSPDYGTTETWSTPSLRNVPWADLVDVEPLDVARDGAA